MGLHYNIRERILVMFSFLLGRIYNILLTSAKYWHIKRTRRKYPNIKTNLFHIDTYIYGQGEISIGEGSYLGKGTFIYCDPKDAKITIGKNCMISHNVHIRTLSYDSAYINLEPDQRKYVSQNITIGDNVWIGANVFIKNGVTLGNNVIIGAGSVVTHSFSNNLIVGGVPAKVIKENNLITL